MRFLHWLAGALTGWWTLRQSVRPHTRDQACGPAWSATQRRMSDVVSGQNGITIGYT